MTSIEEFLEMFANEAVDAPESAAFGPVKEWIAGHGGPRAFAKEMARSADRALTTFRETLNIADRDVVARLEQRVDDLAEYIDKLGRHGDAPAEAPAGLPASQPLDPLLAEHFINLVRYLVIDGLDEEQARAFFLRDERSHGDGYGAREARRCMLEWRRACGRSSTMAAERMATVPVVFSVIYAAARREHVRFQREHGSAARPEGGVDDV